MRTINLNEPTAQDQENQDGDWPTAPPSPEELPAGEYVAAYRGAQRRYCFGQPKVELDFEIVEPAGQRSLHVPLFAVLPTRGRIPVSSKYYALWLMANGTPPRRGDRMTPRVFRGYWRVRVRCSQPKRGGPGMPIITELIEREAGAPFRPMQVRRGAKSSLTAKL